MEQLLKDLIKWLASTTWEQLGYLRNYKSYVDLETEQLRLLAKVENVELKIEEAKKRNKNRVDAIVEEWLKRAKKLVQHDPEPTKCFGFCTNFISQIAQAKDFERLMKEKIPNLIAEADKFVVIAHATGAPHMEFYSQEFMSFKSRMANFDELKKELEDANKYMIGLQGMGGTGKSTMAIQVGKLVEKSNVFDKVMFISVSTPIDEKRIRDDIAKKLELPLEEEKFLTHAQQIWNRIASAGKVLIILDDVWGELNLENIGIHHRNDDKDRLGIDHRIHNKDRCCVLLTTRYENVCTQMSCEKRIKLEILHEKDALKLFLSHAMEIGHKCPNYFRKVAMDIVNECGRLPVIVVAVAKTLKDWPTEEWHDALTILKSADEPLRHGIVDKNAKKFYNSLKLSYNHLEDKEAQVLFLLCSIFPKAHEIPIELLSRIAIGLGLFGEVNKYDTRRSQARVQKNKLLNSSLLLKADAECVKLHDVIRDVALEIANEEIQVIINSSTNLKENMKYSSWTINGFPNGFDGSKLEVLLVWINAKGSLEGPNSFFKGMKSLRVLLLHSKIEFGRTSALLIPESIQSLQNVRTLSLKNWELGDISVLVKNCQKLESLELINCAIIELPNEISNLEKLRFLCLKSCSLEMNNPFEVIVRCLQLEELYYVSNDDHIPIGPKVPQITSLPEYQIYHIDGSDFSAFDSSQLDTSIKRWFKPGKLKNIFSNEVIKSFAARAEVLELGGDDEIAGWKNLIPSIVSIEDGAMGDLVRLSLKHWSKQMKCLIDTEHLQLKYGETFFSKLVELQLIEVDVREICYGRYPDGFLEQLEKLELKKCQMLKSTLFKGKLELGNLKSIDIKDCSMTCLFHPSTAQILRQLETLKIVDCSEMKSIIGDEGSLMEKKVDKDSKPRCQDDPMFPKLKLLHVKRCGVLEFILPISFCEDLPLLESVEISQCKNLRYMFGQYYPEEGGLHEMQKETTLHLLKVILIIDVPLFINIYPECFLPQKSAANTTYKDEPSSFKEADQPDHASSREKYVGNMAHGIFTTPLYPCNLREICIGYISNLGSLFSVSIASSILLLEQLAVLHCDELKHIVTENVDGHNQMNANSIFPNLRAIEVKSCESLEYVFPASCSLNLVHLESVHISSASRLKYVFGSTYGDDNSPHQNHNTKIHLPTLNKLTFERVLNIVSMCPKNYYVKALSLKEINLGGCPQLPINSFIDLSVEGHKGQEQLSNKKVMGMHLSNLIHLDLESLDMVTIYDLERLETASSPLNSCLETLIVKDFDELTNICVGPKNLQLSFQHLSKLLIVKCHQLKFILSASMSRSLPSLRQLWVFQCKELERIIEEDDVEEEYWFPNLRIICAGGCKSLKCLFSISTCGKLPQLSVLKILKAPKLEQVFEWKGATQDLELDIKDMFPKLFMISLRDLPTLHTICPAIDFHPVICCDVQDCPNISLTSADNKFLYSYSAWLEQSESEKGILDELDLLEQRINRMREVAEKTINIKEMRDRRSSVEMAVEEKKGLIFFTDEPKFQMNEILEAFAEVLGEGIMGKTYKVMLNGGASIVVKRLMNIEPGTREEFAKQLHEIADLKHPNLLPLLGYHNSREGRQLLYKYTEKGNLFIRLHGNMGENRTPFTWRSRLSVAKGVARGLSYLHLNAKSNTTTMAPHGNLKSTNILFDKNDTVLVSDYGLSSLISQSMALERMVVFKSPEYGYAKKISKKSDVWSYGSLLLELLTGKLSTLSAPHDVTGSDLCTWIHGTKREEWTMDIFDKEISILGSDQLSGMMRLLQIAMDCSHRYPEKRPDMREVVREVEKIEVEDDDDIKEIAKASNDESQGSKVGEYDEENPESEEAIGKCDETGPESEADEVKDSEHTNKPAPFVAPPEQEEIKVTQVGEICMPYASKQIEDDDLMKPFQMDDGADMEGADEDEIEVTKALADLEATLKMGLNEITSSEESILCIENALNTLSSHCSDDALKATINSLQQEILTILSSFKQAYATIDRATKLEQKEKLMMIEQRVQRREAAMTLSSQIHKIKNSMVEAQTREVELKGQISKLQAEFLQQNEIVMTLLSETHKSESSLAEIQTWEADLNDQISNLHAELNSKEEEIKECEIKLLSLQEKKKMSVSDTAGSIELESVKKERSHMMEEQIKATHQLENVDSMWSSCLANLKKTTLLFRSSS